MLRGRSEEMMPFRIRPKNGSANTRLATTLSPGPAPATTTPTESLRRVTSERAARLGT